MAMQRNLANEAQKIYDVQHNNLGRTFADQSLASQLYQALGLQNQNEVINGSAALDIPTYEYIKPVQPKKKSGGGGLLDTLFDLSPASPGNLSLFGGGGGNRGKGLPGYYKQTGSTHIGAQRGLLDLYEHDIIPAQSRMATAQRTADINDVAHLSPAARNALRIADPQSAALLDQLNGQASDELGMGTSLDPSLMRLVQQSIRGRQQGTLLSNGDAGAYNEALGTAQFGQDLRTQRRGFAGNVINQNQQFYGNPFQSILNRSNPNSALGFGQQASQTVGSAGTPTQDYSQNAYAQDLFNTNFNAAIASQINAANNRTALLGAGISAVGNIAGGAAGAI